MKRNIFKQRVKFLPLLLFAFISVVACNSAKDIVYMQGSQEIENQVITNYKDIIIKPDDLLSILVSSQQPEAAAPFNLQDIDRYVTATGSRTGNGRVLGYLVDKEGCIEFPVLGRLKVSGLTRKELSNLIKEKLSANDQLKDAVVTVQFQNFHISILGEVLRPNKYSIETDRVSILDAIAMAGDLTIYGRRDSVLILRETDEGRTMLYANLLSKDLINSPVYYLQQNDVVYVKPNNIKAQQSGINQNNNVSVWLSVASLLTTIAVLIWR